MTAVALLLATNTAAHAAKSTSLDTPVPAAIAPAGVFQSIEIATNAETGLAGWKSAQAKLRREKALYAACDAGSASCPAPVSAWRNKLKTWQMLPANEKLVRVNRFANAAIAYVDDRKAFGKADHWASPAESLRGRGDCEDYALLKYASLRAIGFGENQLRIVIVNDLTKGIGHAVLSVKTDDGIFILDNQDQRILRHDTISRYAPVYSVNSAGRWINIATRSLKKQKIVPAVLVASSTAPAEEIAPAATSISPVLAAPAATVAAPQPFPTDRRAPMMAARVNPPDATHVTFGGTTFAKDFRLSALWQHVDQLLARITA